MESNAYETVGQRLQAKIYDHDLRRSACLPKLSQTLERLNNSNSVLISHAHNENLGNYLFKLASVVGIAAKNGFRLAVLARPAEYENAFNRLQIISLLNASQSNGTVSISERGAQVFNPKVFLLQRTHSFGCRDYYRRGLSSIVEVL